ncbi:hypothetical protein EUTSA_v10007223mg [Eutrema salsugineum]|uniref:Uncharacterized protein n=1 Tax=Eutrema salsugineum TaxID=72664 RepID=V4L2G7_EUTSA|nr:uncharacterized protein LOC18992169 [Eutrema salsugineum]XP_024008749.1 uncharacterized protein LOC18992169 [Eutrema salsugineum]ESQ33950.1 hypothetical protein EUTSA_v10007223mg [Eutrema salsugineum]ESQ33953.1 hypothetical protein EUTSA_v10007223mg [Eutrema salsugineum]
MAERKLNFNAPLLSTRRMQRNKAVSVRRNKTNKFIDDSNTNGSSSLPVLVPEIGLDQVTEPASVPFTWEQAPGRLKGNDFRFQACDSTQQVFTPCLPPGKVMDILKCPVEKAIDGNLTRLQSFKGKQVEEVSEDEDDVFSDARATLSPKDSFSINHSLSGVSGYGVVETKKPLNRSADAQSRDFMLNRFLPAAKAMTVEQPHYASNRKPSTFMSEPTIQIRELVPGEKRQTPNRYDESIVPPYYDHQDINDEESEEDDVDDGVSEYAYLPKRGCGMLPQLCFKESLGMLNTVPGLKAKHSHDHQVKSSKVSQLKSRFQSVKKLALDSVSKHNLGGKVQSPIHPSVGKKFNSEPNLTVAVRSSSPYRHSRCMSPFRSTGNSSPFHPACFSETRKEAENLRANRLNKHIRNRSRSQELLYPKSNGSTSSLSEKTVYVDTENFPITNDQHNSNDMIIPKEADMGGKKPEANLDLEAFENLSITSGRERSPLAPPSPKKPSESWLLHNLPSVTSLIPARRYPFNPQKQDLNETSRDVTNWETIVKTTYMHRDHIRYSEELVSHTSHQ